MAFLENLTKRTPPTAEQITERLQGVHGRRAARLEALKRGREKISSVVGRPSMFESSAAFIIQLFDYFLIATCILVIIAGFWFDITFYASQAAEWVALVGLVLFAAVMRLGAVGIPALLEWSKPEKKGPVVDDPNDMADDDDKPIKDFMGKNTVARWGARICWIFCFGACIIATLHYFSSGHEERLTRSSSIVAVSGTQTDSQQGRIDALTAEIEAAREDRTRLVDGARQSMALVLNDGVGGNDNLTEFEANIARYEREFTTFRDAKLAEINALRQQKEDVQMEAAEAAAEPPFLGVYRFMARASGVTPDAATYETTVDGFTIAGAIFFTAAFELMCTFITPIYLALTRMKPYVLRRMSAMAREFDLRWSNRLQVQEMQANLAALKNTSTLARLEANERIRIAQEEAHAFGERAKINGEIAMLNRQAEEMRLRSEAIAAGEDPDLYDQRVELEREARRAETMRQLEALRRPVAPAQEAAPVFAREPAPEVFESPALDTAPVPAPADDMLEPELPEVDELTPRQRSARNATEASIHAREARTQKRAAIPVDFRPPAPIVVGADPVDMVNGEPVLPEEPRDLIDDASEVIN